MTETENVATYARIRPYNPAINEDKKLTARAKDGNKILNQNNANEDTYNFTRVFDMVDNTQKLFEDAMKPLLDYKILQGINSIFIVYGQSGSGKSFTLIGEPGHLGVLPMSLRYLLDKEIVERIDVASIEAYGIKAAKIGFYDLVAQLELKKAAPKKFDAYTSKDNSRLNSDNAKMLEITQDNCLSIITKLQEVSHMAPTLKNPHSSRGHTVYFCRIKMTDLEDVYFIAVDLAGSEGQTALGTKDEFISGLQLAMSKGKLHLNKKQMKSFEQMYKTRSFEAGCINNGLTQLQSIFGELIKKKISKSQGLGLRKVLSSFISLKSAYAILFTLSASANNNKVTRATLNFAKQTQLDKVDTQKAKKKIDKDKIIKELNQLIEELRKEMKQKDDTIRSLKKQIENGGGGGDQIGQQNNVKFDIDNNNKDDGDDIDDIDDDKVDNDIDDNDDDDDNKVDNKPKHGRKMTTFDKFDELSRQISDAQKEEEMWTVKTTDINPDNQVDEKEMRQVFDKFDTDGGGSIDAEELQNALKSMGQDLTMDEVNKLIEEIDVNGDGEVDFEEFKVLFGQSWFINMHQQQIVQSMERMMSHMENMNIDLEALEDYDEEIKKFDQNENENNNNNNNQNDKKKRNSIDKSKDEEIKKLQNKINNLREELIIKDKNGEKIENVKKELNELETERDRLQNDVQTLKAQNFELNEEKSKAHSENQELKKDLNEAKVEIKEINKQRETNREIRNSIVSLQDLVEQKLKDQQHVQNQNITSLKKEIEAFKQESLEQQVETITSLKQENNTLKKEQIKQNNLITSQKQEIEKLKLEHLLDKEKCLMAMVKEMNKLRDELKLIGQFQQKQQQNRQHQLSQNGLDFFGRFWA